MNRRNFIGKTAVGAAAVTVIPRHVLGGNGFVAANDKINLGYIGNGKELIIDPNTGLVLKENIWKIR